MGATGGSFSPIGIFGAITNGVVDDNDLPGNPLLPRSRCLAAAASIIALIAFLVFGGRELMTAQAATRTPLARGRAPPPPRRTPLGDPRRRHRHAGVRRRAGRGGVGGGAADDRHADRPTTTRAQRGAVLTLVGLVVARGLRAGAAISTSASPRIAVAVVLTLIFPRTAKGAVDKISWGTVLLIGGIVTYVTLLQEQGTVQWLGDEVAGVGAPADRRAA